MSKHTFYYSGSHGNEGATIQTTYEAVEETWPKILYEFVKHLSHAYGYSIVERVQVNGKPLEDEAYRF